MTINEQLDTLFGRREKPNHLEMDEYQVQAARTINTHLSKEEITLHALHGMSSEVGEVHSLFQKVYQGHELDLEHLKSELGDLMWFIAELCQINGWKMSEIGSHNIEKLKKRYPFGFDANRSQNREKGDL